MATYYQWSDIEIGQYVNAKTDEELWHRLVLPPWPYQYYKSTLFFGEDAEIGKYVNATTDEEFWLKPAVPLQYNWNRAFFDDGQDIGVYAQVATDEELWFRAPYPAQYNWNKAFGDDDILPVPPPFAPDDDSWNLFGFNYSSQSTGTYRIRPNPSDGETEFAPTSKSYDFWHYYSGV